MGVRRRLRWWYLVGAAVAGASPPAAGKQVTLSIGHLEIPGLSAQTLRASLQGPQLRELEVEVDRLTLAGRTWRKLKLRCPELDVAGTPIACRRGVLEADEKIPLELTYSTNTRDFAVAFKPAPDETWRLSGRAAGAQTLLNVSIDRGRLARFASWIPAAAPKVNGGRASGTLQLRRTSVSGRLAIDELAFSDASGLRAGEKIGATLEASATAQGNDWHWNARLAWRSGAVFWQPLFVSAKDQRLHLEGSTRSGITDITRGRLELPDVGGVDLSAQWNHAQATLSALEARAVRLQGAALYEDFLKGFLQGTPLADMRVEGVATLGVRLAGGELAGIDADVSGVSFEDRRRRFGIFGATGKVWWRRNEESRGEIAIQGAEFLNLPIGAVKIPLRLSGARVAVGEMRVPILDGALLLRDFQAGTTDEGWGWRFRGELAPVSMVQLTQALGMPVMRGSVAGVIPDVQYRRGTLGLDGALVIRVFDGTVSVSQMRLLEPFSRAPRLHADVEMKNLDLELLTGTFDFGNITGRIDARVRNLELVDWQPIRFDARVESSAGSYPRKISQRAVQNISALGGAGAAVAIQRSFLRFFDQFGYERLGLSCRLENGVCEMDGIERAPQGYVIVKGGGVPAISVIGYNHQVNWRELVERLERITQGNVKPIVK